MNAAPQTDENAPRDPVYAEDFCALRWPLPTWGLIVPGALAVADVVVAVISQKAWYLLGLAIVTYLWLAPGVRLWQHWRSSIRIDERGVRIGAARRAERSPSRRPRDRPPRIPAQARGLFTCRWDGILGLRVVTGRGELRKLRDLNNVETALRYRWAPGGGAGIRPLGVLIPPFMRAALVIELDLDLARYPDVPVTPYQYLSDETRNHHVVWVAPTRRAGRLRKALEGFQPHPMDTGVEFR